MSTWEQVGELDACLKKQYFAINNLDSAIASVTNKLGGDLVELQESIRVSGVFRIFWDPRKIF